MSLQVFLQAHLFGSHEFLAHLAANQEDTPASFQGRCAWLNLFCEVLPRALLAELSLSRMLLGSASADQFLLVLAEEDIPRANELLSSAAAGVDRLSGSKLRLAWAATENLGPWPIASKRLDEVLQVGLASELAHTPHAASSVFAPFSSALNQSDSSAAYFETLSEGVISAQSVGWSPEEPAQFQWNSGRHSWPLVEQLTPDADGIVFSKRIAQDDAGHAATMEELAVRAEGAGRWGILLADVDHFTSLLKAQGSVEEHIHLSVLFKEFFAGELSVLCTLPEFWRKITVLYRGGDSFAVLGSWDALVNLAREIQRLFARFVEEHLQTGAAQDGRTISMALAISDEASDSLSRVFAQAAARLREAKTNGPDTFHLFGRILEWKRLNDAEELKTSLVRLVKRHGYSPDYIHDLASVYRESSSAARSASLRRKTARVDKPWRLYLRLARVIPQERGKEVNNLRSTVISSLIGKRTSALKLRPSGRVGLEWARLATGSGDTAA